MDASGNATAVWYQYDGTRYNVWANRYSPAAGTWGTAVLIETNNAGLADMPRVTVDPGGNVTTVWRQSDGTWFRVWANRFD